MGYLYREAYCYKIRIYKNAQPLSRPSYREKTFPHFLFYYETKNKIPIYHLCTKLKWIDYIAVQYTLKNVTHIEIMREVFKMYLFYE